MKYNFVVQRSAIKRVRMADQRGAGRSGRAGIEQRFKPSGWTGNEQRADGGAVVGHAADYLIC